MKGMSAEDLQDGLDLFRESLALYNSLSRPAFAECLALL